MTALLAYIEAWVANDSERIAGAVAEDCLITECYGPVYRGRARELQWASQRQPLHDRLQSHLREAELEMFETDVTRPPAYESAPAVSATVWLDGKPSSAVRAETGRLVGIAADIEGTSFTAVLPRDLCPSVPLRFTTLES